MSIDAIRLSPRDNVAVIVGHVPAGGEVDVDGLVVAVDRDVGIGHKIALHQIAKGAQILKHGMPIGSATRDIAPGAHVHVHNMQSDYLPTLAPEGGRGVGE